MLPLIWLTKMVLAHLLADFVLQPRKWVEDRFARHFASPYLYLHGLITAAVACLLVGWTYWPFIIVVLLTHLLIDGWKSYRPKSVGYFLLDQALHIAVILGCWYVAFFEWADVVALIEEYQSNYRFWVILTGFVLVTFPSGIAIGLMTKRWSDQLPNGVGLANAGKWIGITERAIILLCILVNQFGSIGFLITAKGLLRYSEKDRPEVKTEYVLIGSLISVCFSLMIGIVLRAVLAQQS